MWQYLALGASIGMGALGQHQANKAIKEGAASTARMEDMNRKFQEEVFRKNIEMQKPFYEAGKAAIQPYQDAILNKSNPMASGLAQFQKGQLGKSLSGAPEYVKKMAMDRLTAEEGEREKARLLDLQRIGLGASGSAGQSAANLGGALAQSYGVSGRAEAGAIMGDQMAKQNMWVQALDTLSGLPAYLSSTQRPKAQPDLSQLPKNLNYGANNWETY